MQINGEKHRPNSRVSITTPIQLFIMTTAHRLSVSGLFIRGCTVDVIGEKCRWDVTSTKIEELWKRELQHTQQQITSKTYQYPSRLAIIAKVFDPQNLTTPLEEVHVTLCVITVTADQQRLQNLMNWVDKNSHILNLHTSVVPRQASEFVSKPNILIQFTDGGIENKLRQLSRLGETPNPDGERVYHITMPPSTTSSFELLTQLRDSLQVNNSPDTNIWRNRILF